MATGMSDGVGVVGGPAAVLYVLMFESILIDTKSPIFCSQGHFSRECPGGSGGGQQGGRGGGKEGCFKCGEHGHFSRECSKRS